MTLTLDPTLQSTIDLIARLTKAHDEAFIAAQKAEPKKTFIKMPMAIKPDSKKVKGPTPEEDVDVLTGLVAIRFKAKASGIRKKDKSKWTFKPALFDSATPPKPLPADVLIFGGSVIKVSYVIKHTPMPTGSFYTSFSLKAVQVIDLKALGARDASEYGFTGEADGFDSNEGDEGETSGGDGPAPQPAGEGGEDF